MAHTNVVLPTDVTTLRVMCFNSPVPSTYDCYSYFSVDGETELKMQYNNQNQNNSQNNQNNKNQNNQNNQNQNNQNQNKQNNQNQNNSQNKQNNAR